MLRQVADTTFMVAILAASVFLWMEADRFPSFPRMRTADSDFWPKLVFGFLIAMSVIYLIRVLVISPFWRSAESQEALQVSASAMARFAIMAVLIVGYFLCLQWTGFAPATVVFLLLASSLLPMGDFIVRLLFAPIFTALIIGFFTRLLSLPLPRGTGVFYQFSLLIY